MINSNRKQEIKEIVSSLEGKTLYQIAKDHQISIYDMDFVEINENIAGAIKFNIDSGKFSIFIEQSNSNVRKRFTLAHELGHYFLHKDILKDHTSLLIDDNSNMLYRNSNRNIIEEEANAFAAELLMPEHLVRLARNKLRDIDEMIRIFDVSAIAMSYRLTNLNLLNEENEK